MIRRNYGFAFTAPVIGVLLVGVPIFLFGMGAVIKFMKIMFSPVSTTGIPVWAVVFVGIMLLLIFRRKPGY